MEIDSTSTTLSAIHPDTAVGSVRLTVSNLDRSRSFYERAIGLVASELEDGGLALGAGADRALIELHGDSSAAPLNRRAPGLYHLAILVPTRRDLAFAFTRLAATRWPLDGASDHLVSEALYLSDPDGNGIEVYLDRPRDRWPRSDGALQMATLPLDLDGVLRELGGSDAMQPVMPPATRIGHVHLQVSSLEQAESFYRGVLGFEVTVRAYQGALFVSAGGYHHHLGLNTWHSRGAAPPPPGAIGLRNFEIELPDQQQLQLVVDRVLAAGITVEPTASGLLIRDPFANGVVLRTR